MTLHAGKGAVHFILSEFLPSVEDYQRMLEVAQRMGDRAREAEALCQIGFGFHFAHEFEKALEYSERAKALALEIGAKGILAASIYVIGFVNAATGKLGEGDRCFEESLRISREAGDKGTEGFNLDFLGLVRNWVGEYERALLIQEQAFHLAQDHDLRFNLMWNLWCKGLSLSGKGRYEEALVSLKNGLELSEQLGDKIFKCRILNSLGWVYGELYNLEPAIRHNQEGAEASRKIGEPEIIRNAEINLGDNCMLLGDLEQAQSYLEKVHRDSQQSGKWGEEWMKWRYSQHLYHSLGELWLRKGDAGKALAFAEECLKLAEPTSSRKNMVKGWRLTGQVFLTQGKLQEAEESFKKALTMALEIGNPPQLWQTYQAMGELYERKGEKEQARSAYGSAIQVIEEVAGRLQDQELKRNFLSSHPVQDLRQSFQRLSI